MHSSLSSIAQHERQMMNAISVNDLQGCPVGLALPDDLAFEDWVSLGRDLANQRRNVDWMLGDWLAQGRERFADQIQFDFLADALGIAPKRLRTAAEVAQHFPPAARDETLSIEHHAHVAALPSTEALTILKKAKEQHLTPEETRIEAVKCRAIIEPPLIRDDPEYDQLIAISRAWNRANASVREQFMDLANEANLGVIDA
jgi:hypothetical protein